MSHVCALWQSKGPIPVFISLLPLYGGRQDWMNLGTCQSLQFETSG